MVDPMGLLASLAHDPLAYSSLLFIYALAAAVILPLPVELGLLNSSVHWSLLASVIGAGKAAGSVLVFRIGAGVEEQINKWVSKFPQGKPWLGKLERFIARYGYAALFVLLCIPFMSDTIVLYLFSVLNPSVVEATGGKRPVPGAGVVAERAEVRRGEKRPHALHLLPFVSVNFVAGVVRSLLFLLLFTDAL